MPSMKLSYSLRTGDHKEESKTDLSIHMTGFWLITKFGYSSKEYHYEVSLAKTRI